MCPSREAAACRSRRCGAWSMKGRNRWRSRPVRTCGGAWVGMAASEGGGPRMDLQDVYTNRFTDREATTKSAVWREITAYLQRFIPLDARVLDIACDRGDFIRHVRAAERWATDLRPVGPMLPEDVRFVQADGLRL